MKRLIVGVCFGLPLILWAQQPQTPLPARDTTTVADLFDRLGRCHSTIEDERRYQERLIARIRELEQQKGALEARLKTEGSK